jgi:hypothetical protein
MMMVMVSVYVYPRIPKKNSANTMMVSTSITPGIAAARASCV